MHSPTRQQVIEAHNSLEHLVKSLYGIPLEEAKNDTSYKRLAKFLPPKPRITMNEIRWDDREHFLAEAEHHEYGKVVMIRESELVIFVQPVEGVIGEIKVAALTELTPTGKRYTLKEVSNAY